MTTEPDLTGLDAATGDAEDAEDAADLAALAASFEPEFTLGETTFHMSKIPALEGLAIFHILRRQMAKSQRELKDESPDFNAILQHMAMDLPADRFDTIRHIGFRHVRFSNAHTSHQVLAGAEEAACKHTLDIVDVWVRMVAFNFLESFIEKLSGLGLRQTT